MFHKNIQTQLKTLNRSKLYTGLIALITLVIIFSGCDGDSSKPQLETPVLEGTFVDSRVEGLTYLTTSQSGLTDADGTFLYKEGETVTFSIGDLVIGRAPGGDIITPLDLVPDADDENHPAVTNISRLIQALDQDGNPDNGIEISASVAAEMPPLTIDFNQPPEHFADSADVAALFNRLNTRRLFGDESDRHLSTAFAAREHLKKTLYGRWRVIRADRVQPGETENRSVIHYRYNPEGHLSREEYDRDGDGVIDATASFSYDDRGRRSIREYDSDNDGVMDGIERYEYATEDPVPGHLWNFENPFLQEILKDYSVSGNQSNWSAYTQLLEEKIVEDEEVIKQIPLEDLFDCIVQIHFNREENTLTAEHQINNDASPDYIVNERYYFDENGYKVKTEWEYSAPESGWFMSTPEIIIISGMLGISEKGVSQYEYGDGKKLIAESRTSTHQYPLFGKRLHTYDENTNLVMTETIATGGELIDSVKFTWEQVDSNQN